MDLLGGGRIGHHEVFIISQSHDDGIVENDPPVIQDVGVEFLARLKFCVIIGEESTDEIRSSLSPEIEIPHMGNIEDPGVLPYSNMLPANGGILHRHLPAGKFHHAAAQVPVVIVECSSLHGACKSKLAF